MKLRCVIQASCLLIVAVMMVGLMKVDPVFAAGLVQDKRTAVRGHTETVTAVVFSPDGQLALSGSFDHTLRLWEIASGKELRVFTGHTDTVRSVAFSPDGQLALSGGQDKTLRLWEVATGKELRVFTGHTRAVEAVTFSPDGRLALSGAGWDDNSVRIWDVATGIEIRSFFGLFTGDIKIFEFVTFSPDGKLLVVGKDDEDRTLELWDIATGEKLRPLGGGVNRHSKSVTGGVFSNNVSQVLSFDCEGDLRLWDVATGEAQRTFSGQSTCVESAVFSPDGKLLLSAGGDKSLRLWDLASGQELKKFSGYKETVATTAFSPDGRLALLGGYDGSMRLWDVSRWKERRVFSVPAVQHLSGAAAPASSAPDVPRQVVVATPAPALSRPQDTTPPVITITSPQSERRIASAAPSQSRLTVIGKASDESGVAEVTVNGIPASLDGEGGFFAEILLRVGENAVTVEALDVRKNRSVTTLTVTRAASAVTTATPAPSTNGLGAGTYYALMIAVEDYTNPAINRLEHPVADTERLKSTLIAHYTFENENVIFLRNPERKAIYKALNDLKSKITERDSLLIFYAGHGVWQETMQQGFWLPKDASGVDDPSDWISNSAIRDYIKAIKAKHILLVADACFSGGIFKVRDAFSQTNSSAEQMYQIPSRKAITSGALKTVPDKSVFVEYLLKRLIENPDRYLDAQKLFVSFKEAVINNSPSHQTPLYGAINEAGDEGGDFIFVHR